MLSIFLSDVCITYHNSIIKTEHTGWYTFYWSRINVSYYINEIQFVLVTTDYLYFIILHSLIVLFCKIMYSSISSKKGGHIIHFRDPKFVSR